MTQHDEMKSRYDAISQQINREDDLVNKRLTWTLTFSGLLFAALGFLAGTNKPDQAVLDVFKIALPLMGIAISLAGLFGVLAAYIQLYYLTGEWESLNDSRWVRPFGSKRHSFVLGTAPCFVPPIALTVVWFSLLRAWW